MELNDLMKLLSKADRFPFHMPGHKGRFPSIFGCFDPTELPGLDNLHCPVGVLARAQERVGDIYQTGKTYFLVNGSSVGIMAAMATVAKPGTLILVQRTCHKAVLAGLIHSGAMPVWVEQDYCQDRQHWLPPSKDQIQQLLAANPIRAAIFTNPDYYGLAPDIAGITKVCQDANIPVLVDEAHGAHLAFGQALGLPVSGVEAKADIVIQSPHKTLPALTQSAWMHLNNLDLSEGLQETLNLFQTTSPSYLLMASLEHAAAHAEKLASSLLKRLNLLAKILEHRGRALGFKIWPRSQFRDWTKFVLPRRKGMGDVLKGRGIYPEMIQGNKVLLMLTMADALDCSGIAYLNRLMPELAALPELDEPQIELCPPLPPQACTPREAWMRKGEKIPVAKALGRIVRQVAAPYPPGTMILAPGQRLDQNNISYLKWLQAGKVIPEWIEVI